MKKRGIAIIIAVTIGLALTFYFIFRGPSEAELSAWSDELFSHIEKGDSKKTAAFLEEHPEVLNKKNAYGDTPLEAALHSQFLPVAIVLAEKGAVTDASALLEAVHSSMDAIQMEGWSEEQRKARVGLFKMLIDDQRNKIDAKDDQGNTALALAASKGDAAVVELLLKNGADASIRNDIGHHALHAAVIKGNLSIVQLIAEYDRRLLRNEGDPFSFLHLAVENGRKELYDYLLEHDTVGIDLQNEEGQTALSLAAAYGDQETVRYLLEKGADKAIKSKDGMLALDYAKQSDNREIIALLQ